METSAYWRNKMQKLLIPLSLLATSIATAEVSMNAGYATEYHYRGIFQSKESFNAGVDLDVGNLNVGVWTADVGDGAEIDLYGSYTWEIDDLAFSAGMTGYYYTGDFDETYEEVNLGLDYKFLSLEHSIGTWDGEGGMDYDFTAVTAEWNGLYATFGIFGKEFEGDYAEAGYGLSWQGFDWGVSYITAEDEKSLVGTISRSF